MINGVAEIYSRRCKKIIHISTELLWPVFQILTETVPIKYGKLAAKYPRMYGYFYSVQSAICTVDRLADRQR